MNGVVPFTGGYGSGFDTFGAPNRFFSGGPMSPYGGHHPGGFGMGGGALMPPPPPPPLPAPPMGFRGYGGAGLMDEPYDDRFYGESMYGDDGYYPSASRYGRRSRRRRSMEYDPYDPYEMDRYPYGYGRRRRGGRVYVIEPPDNRCIIL